MKNITKIFGAGVIITLLLTLFTTTAIGYYNDPPNPPEITGPTSGNTDTATEFHFTVTDPNDDLLEKLEIDWGDGEIEEVCAGCTGPRWPSGTTKDVDHTWKDSGDYNIKARVMDVYGEWSEWSDPFSTTMPRYRSRIFTFSFLQDFLQKIFQFFNT